jgi:aryl-alcohol dehydrogenase-like predicted oxidoreductase
MELRKLGKTDLEVTRISMGTMTFGNQVSESDGIRMIDRCLEFGINFFDTANIYNNGQSETILGKALSGRRHKVVLATKVRGKMSEEPDDEGLTRAALRKAIDASLQRLGTDYVDLYYLHQPDWNTEIEETLAAMDELVTEGKVRYPASSNYAAWQIVQMLWHCDNHGFVSPTVSQPMYNLLARGIEQEYLNCCREYEIAVIAYNPLAGGLLTGKHAAGAPPATGTRFDGNKMYQDRYWHQAYFHAAEKLTAMADSAGMSIIDLAFRWILAQSQVDSVILGATSMDQLEQNFKACQEPPLSDEVLVECDALWQELRGVTPKYNR